MRDYIKVLFAFLAFSQFTQAQTACSDGEVGIIVTVHTVNSGSQVSWNVSDLDDIIYATNPFTYASNFTYVSEEICLPEGETYVFNSFDAGGNGWGSGAWYEVAMCGGNTLLIDNNGNSPTGTGNTEEFTLPVISEDNCYCFEIVDFDVTSTSTATSADGVITPEVYAGTPEYTYLWSNGATTSSLVGVEAGPYYVTVTDANGCEVTALGEVQGPNIFMMPGSITACTGYFYDSGGANGTFSPGENYTLTICSDDPNASSSINFYEFTLGGAGWNTPTFTIYDGDTPANPVLYSYDSPGDPAPGYIQASENNATGCLTVVFNSVNSQNIGWFGEINCMYPCQDYAINIVSDDNITANSEIDVCYDLEFELELDFFENNQGYSQEVITTSIEWDFGDGTTATGPYTTHLYDQFGEYELNLVVTDVNGCQIDTTFNAIYDNPGIITGLTVPEESDVCPGTELTAGTPGDGDSTTFWSPQQIVEYSNTFSEELFIPDGPFCPPGEYQTSLGFTNFNVGQTLNDVNDIVEVCVNMEHTWMGDIMINLIAPNGAEVVLLEDQNGVGVGNGMGNYDLGEPDFASNGDACEPDDNPPGVGYTYCWSPNPTAGGTWHQLEAAGALGSPVEASVPDLGLNIYPAYNNSFNDVLGTELNGDWSIEVIDTWGGDNGWIFEWWINFSPSIVPPDLVMIPQILDYNWYCEQDPSSIVLFDSSHVVVAPVNPGLHTYEMTLLDDFGCEYHESFDVNVYGPPVTSPDFVVDCQPTFGISVTNETTMGGAWEVLNHPVGSTVTISDETSLTPQITVSETGVYVFEFTETECKYTDDLTVDVDVVNPEINEPDLVICELLSGITVVEPTGNGGWWTITPLDTGIVGTLSDNFATSAQLTSSDFGMYQIAYTIDFCFGTDSAVIEFRSVDPTVSNPSAQICDYDIALEVVNPSPTGGYWELKTQPNHTTVDMSNPTLTALDIEVDAFGVYEFMYTINGCETKDSVEVVFFQRVPEVTSEDLVQCGMIAELSVETHGLEVGWEQVSGPDVATITHPTEDMTAVVVDQYGDYGLSYTSCDTTVEFNILFMCDLELPNVFSPNGDDENDELIIEGLTHEFYSYSNMSIYNRWGDEVYSNGAYGLDGSWWDGQTTHGKDPITEGVYYYVLKVGNKVTDREDIYRGTIHLFQD